MSEGSTHGVLEMPCLGRPFQLGTLYDCRNDSLIPGVTLWGPDTLGTAGICKPMEGSDFEIITEDSLNEKSLHLDISAGLKLGIFSGLVKAGGSGKFLYDRTTSKYQARVSLRYKATSKFEQLNMSHLGHGKFEYPRVFEEDIATHVVTGVQYGADAIFVFDRQVDSQQEFRQVHGNMEAMVSALPSINLEVGGSADLDVQSQEKQEMEKIQCKFYGDFTLPKNPTTYQDAVRVYQELPKLLGRAGYPNSVPKKVWLYPLSKLDSRVQRMVHEISSYLIYDLQEVMESLHELEVRINDLIRKEVCVYFVHIRGDLEKLNKLIGDYRLTTMKNISTLLPKVRGGGEEETKLVELLEMNSKSPFSREQVSSWIKEKEKEINILAVYLEELQKHNIQFAFQSEEMVRLTSGLAADSVLCFDFNIPARKDAQLQRIENYLRSRRVDQELQLQSPLYKSQELRQQLQRFVSFVTRNCQDSACKYVVTNSYGSENSNVGVMVVFVDAYPTEFEPPDQPGVPCASSKTHNSLRLNWNKSKYGSSSVQSYTVSYRSVDDPPADQWSTQTSSEECLVLTKLTPGSLYRFKVTAESAVGSGPDSKVGEERLPPDQPGKLQTVAITHNSLRLEWTKPEHGASVVSSYTISYRLVDDQSDQWCNTQKTAEEFLKFTKLTPGTHYQFKVVAESSAGPSPASELFEIMLPPDQPGKPQATAITHNSLRLEWTKPEHGASIVFSYTISYRSVDNLPDHGQWYSQTSSEECLVLTKLTPGSLYHFKVTAESAVGSGPDSKVGEERLPPDQPGKLQAVDITHNSLRLEWTKPEHGASVVSSYSILYRLVDDQSDQWCNTKKTTEEFLKFTKLTPGTHYRFKVVAESPAGSSPASELFEITLPPDQPGKPQVTDITHNSLRLEWTKPEHGASIVFSYTISFYCSEDDHKDQTSTGESFVLTKLTPGMQYQFKVVAESPAGPSPASEVFKITLPPDQPGKPQATDITHNSLRLEWTKPEHGASVVSLYTISYYSVSDHGDQTSNGESLELTKLTPGTQYQFKVVAESPAGPSPASEVYEVMLPPDQPGKPQTTDITHNSLRLEWTKPEHGASVVSLYTIYYYSVNDNGDQTSNGESLELTKLTPGTLYKFKVVAESPAGPSPASEVCEVTLPPDQPGKPQATDITHKSLRLEWTKPEHGAKIVNRYSVRYCSLDDTLDQWYTQTCSEECLVLTKLTPGTHYQFKVVAVSPAGSSPESEVGEERLPPDQPGKPQATDITHNSLRLEWTKPEHGASVVSSYTISYYSMNDHGDQTSNGESLELTKLTPGTQYQFKVVAESPAGPSPASEVCEVSLPPDQPGKPQATDITHNSLRLEWTKPEHGASVVSSYAISYYSMNDNGDQTSNGESLELTKLTPGTQYQFKVVAESPAGPSPASEVCEVSLPPDQPGKPQATDITHKSLRLEWTKPEHGAKIVNSYTVRYCSLDDTPDQWYTQTCSKECAMLTKLTPGTHYQFKVVAVSPAGSSPESEVGEERLPSDQPGKPQATDITHNSLRLEWTKPEQGGSVVSSYTISYYSVNDNGDQMSNGESLELTKLTPGTQYQFKVVAESPAGPSPASEVCEVSLPPDQPGKPQATDITHKSLRLEWTKPEHGAKIVNSYSVRYCSLDDTPDQWYTQTCRKECAMLTKLTPGTHYQFKVVAVSPAGSSPESEVGEERLPPDQPGKPQATDITHNSLRLEWTKPEHGASVVSSYTTRYRSVDDPPDQWCACSSPVMYAALTKLTPGSLLHFKIIAESDAGSSPASEVCEVKLPPSQPGEPWAVAITPYSIQLQWDKPKYGAEIIESYIVKYHSFQFDPWSSLSTTDVQESALLTNLIPKRSYHVKVQAVSSAGASPFSETIGPIETPLPPPGKPHASKITSSGLHLIWDKPEDSANFVTSYTVLYRTVDDSKVEWNEKKTNSAEVSIVLGNLTPDSFYYFKVRAETATGPSAESAISDQVQNKLASLEEPHISNVTHNSLRLSWKKPKHGAEYVQRYTVLYRSGNDEWIPKTTTTAVEFLDVVDLCPGKSYYFKLRAETANGSSGESNTSTVTLPPGQPGEPRVTVVTHNSMQLHWDKPEHGAKIVESYTVMYRHASLHKWSSQSFNAAQLSILFTGFVPKQCYYFKVQAMSNFRKSPESKTIGPIETLLPPPGKPHKISVTDTTVVLKWDCPVDKTKSVVSYTILYSHERDTWHSYKTGTPQNQCTVMKLSPKTVYRFKVRAETSTQPSSDSELSDPFETLLPPPGKPYAISKTHNSIQLTWKEPVHGAESVRFYAVYSKKYAVAQSAGSSKDWKKHQFSDNNYSVCIETLAPKQSYVFKVVAESITGSSPDSELSDPIETLLPPPGIPYATDITYENLLIKWEKPKYQGVRIQKFSLFYRSDQHPDKWDTLTTDGDVNHLFFSDVSPKTSYIFKVVAVTSEGISSESKPSEPIKTKPKPWGARLLPCCKKISEETNPSIHQLPLHYTMKKRNDIAKVVVGQGPLESKAIKDSDSHKVLMLVGATGAGKSTLINGIVNYIMDVDWENNFRLKLISEETALDQSKSQTKCITAYTFYKDEGSPLPYNLTIIDTPGFGDTGGLERDKEIVAQIKEFFSIRSDEGIDQLHGIGFVTQAPLARLTPTQRYVFDSILSVFGKDVADNIFLMVTFADGERPPVLDAVKAAKVPFNGHFKFNNSALFASNQAEDVSVGKMFWEMGKKNFQKFFDNFAKAQTQSLQQSRQVLQEREHLQTLIQSLQQQIRDGLNKIAAMQKEKEVLKMHEADITANREFTYSCPTVKDRRVDVPEGRYVTNCLTCTKTCHANCIYNNDDDKFKCSAMKQHRGTQDATCGVCTNKCSWREHVNRPYRIESYTEVETRTSDELKIKFDAAMTGKNKVEALMKAMEKELEEMDKEVYQKIVKAQQCLQRLRKIALRPDYLTEVEYIELLIKSEEQEARDGWSDRVTALQNILDQVKIFNKSVSVSAEKGAKPFSDDPAQRFSVLKSFTNYK